MTKKTILLILRKTAREFLPPLLIVIGAILLWEILAIVFNVPEFVLPRPSLILDSLTKWTDVTLMHARFTLESTLLGFVIAVVVGLGLGFAIGYSAILYRAFYPLLVAFNCIPKVAIVPILVIWFGVGQVPPILTAFLISFFPIIVNVTTGLATIEPELRDVFNSLGASKRELFTKVGIPRSMPYFFASLKVASTLAFVGAVIAETVAGERGIGHLMLAASARFDVPLVFAGLTVIAVLGIGIFAVFAVLERRLISWAYR